VHCPGTHRFFRRGDPPVRAWIDERLPFALGTDSRASNDSLDLFLEMWRLHRADASIAPRAIVEAATAGGARALANPRIGNLRPGSYADFVIVDVPVSSRTAGRSLEGTLYDALVDRPAVVAVHSAA